MENIKQEIIDVYLKFVKENKKLPSLADFIKDGYDRSKIKRTFGNMTFLHDIIITEHKNDFEQYLVHEKTLFTKQKLKDLQNKIKTTKRFVITTAVSGKDLNVNFYKSIKNYCKRNNALLIVMPAADKYRIQEKNMVFDKTLKDELFCFSEIKLNENLFLSSILLAPKQVKPITGLSRLGQRHGSYIFASPKQFLEYVISSDTHEKMPHAIMSTGCITESNYSSENYLSERSGHIADSDHVMGAIVVEIRDNKLFHFRQIQSDNDGSFIDLAVCYRPNGKINKEEVDVVLGDWHVGSTSEICKKAIKDMCKFLNVKDLILHDFFDGRSINHHILNQPLKMGMRAQEKNDCLLEEIKLGGEDINWLHSLIKGNLIFVRGNHDEFLERYLLAGTFMSDYKNQIFGLELAKSLTSNIDPLVYAYENYGDIKNKKRNVWLYRDSSYKIGGVELGKHGDMGFNGAKASLSSLERAYGSCTVGHNHGAAIHRNVFRVGTMTHFKLDYNKKSPSTWTWTNCLQYKNGSRQLINYIKTSETDCEWKI